MKNFIDSYYFKNRKLILTTESEVQKEPLEEIVVYEIFRVIDSIPMFIEDHLARLNRSFEVLGICKTIINPLQLKQDVLILCQKNMKHNGNMELNVVFSSDKNLLAINLGFIPHHYPEPKQYTLGVKTLLLHSERENPNAKVKDTQTRKMANDLMDKTGVFEVILVNHLNQITEGSRSNFFLIKGEQVFSAPENMVLQGITRKYVVMAINNLKVALTYEAIFEANLSEFDAAFICGTSPGIMPVQSIGDVHFNVDNILLISIMHQYKKIVSEYLHQHRISDKN